MDRARGGEPIGAVEPFWAQPQFVLFAILAYLALHLAIRMAMGQALSIDDAEQALFSQHYAWTYRYREPPLFTWVLVALNHVVPISAFSIGLLRYLFLGILYASVYGVARRLIADPRLAALAVYSFAALGTFAEASHRNLTHTTALAAFLGLAWYVFLRLVETPRLGWYVALGAVFGLGVLAKWNFVIFAVALPLTCLLRRETRALVLTWKVVPAAVVAAAIMLPSVLAAIEMGPPPGESVEAVFHAASGPGISAALRGTVKLLDTALVYALPLLPVVLIIFAQPLWRSLRAGSRDAPRRQGRNGVTAAFIGLTIVVGMGLLWAIVLALGGTELKLRYVYPALLILPVWLMMAVERGRPSGRALGLFALVLVAMFVFVAGKRAALATGMIKCDLCTEYYPYQALAAQLKQAGYSGDGTILGSEMIGGNLRVAFPEARIIDATYSLTRWPAPRGEGQCLLVWSGTGGDDVPLPRSYAAYLSDDLSGNPGAPNRSGTVSAAFRPPAEGEASLQYRLYDGPNGDCR